MKHNWKYKRLGDIAPAMPFKGTIASADGKYWCLNLDKIESNTGVVLEYDFVEESELGGSVHQFTVDNVLFSKLRPNLNKVVVPKHDGYCTTELVPLHPLNNLSRYYLAYYLRSPKYVNFLVGKTGGAKMPRVKMDIFWNSTIPVPPMDVQEQIVAELDQINDLIAKNRELLSQLDALAQSLFYDTFGDPVSNTKRWTTQTISKIAPQYPYGGDLSVEDDVWLLNLDMIEKNTGRIISHHKVKYEDVGNSVYKICPNQVLYSKLRPNLNKVVIADDFGFCTSELLPLNPKQGIINSEYLAYLLRTKECVNIFSGKVAGAKMPRTDLKIFRTFQIPVPPLALQEDFAAKVEAIEAQKKKVDAQIAELKTLLDARMDYWFN